MEDDIREETRTIFIYNGTEYRTLESALLAKRTEEIQKLLCSDEAPYIGIEGACTSEIACFIAKNTDKIISILGGMKEEG
jgi:hypothetical protein